MQLFHFQFGAADPRERAPSGGDDGAGQGWHADQPQHNTTGVGHDPRAPHGCHGRKVGAL